MFGSNLQMSHMPAHGQPISRPAAPVGMAGPARVMPAPMQPGMQMPPRPQGMPMQPGMMPPRPMGMAAPMQPGMQAPPQGMPPMDPQRQQMMAQALRAQASY